MSFLAYWCILLNRARDGGDPDSGTTVLRWLAGAVKESNLDEPMRDFLSTALEEIAAASPGKSREAAARKFLLLGRARGRAPKFQAFLNRYSAAKEVFDRVGEASGRTLDDACTDVLRKRGLGAPGNLAPDLRAIRKEYRVSLPYFLADVETAREAAEREEAEREAAEWAELEEFVKQAERQRSGLQGS